MNGFLVIECHMRDDIPVALVATRTEAISIAQSHEPMTGAWERWGRDAATPDCVKVVEFISGQVSSVSVVKEFE